MDNGRGSFSPITDGEFTQISQEDIGTKHRRIDRIFAVGEIVDIKDSKFAVRSIDHFTGIMTLKLQPRGK